MPIFTRNDIVKIAKVMLCAGGAAPGHAEVVGNHLAEANLAGHDSHGFIRIPQYLDTIKAGLLNPKAKPEIVFDYAATAYVDGKTTFGQVVATMATDLAIKKARTHGISIVSMGNHDHTGRIGTYPEMAVKEGMAAIMFGGGFRPERGHVAPFGGRTGVLGTNPISMGFPQSEGPPILLDFATSMAAEGKLRVYRNRGVSLPGEWLVDKHGNLSDDPNSYYDGGALLPMGGSLSGHKGYALSIMVALFGGLLGQSAVPSTTTAKSWDGSSIIVVDLEHVASSLDVKAHLEEMTQVLHQTPPADGFDSVLYPGEIEAKTRQNRMENGIQIEQATWDQVKERFGEYGVMDELAGMGDR